MAGPAGRVDAVLVCGGVWHDFDYARLQLLQALGTQENVRTRVFEDFSHTAALEQADVVITYTCNVRPSETEQQALGAWVDGGGRLLALHGTSSAIDPLYTAEGLPRKENPRFGTPRVFDRFAQLLGNQFIAHPPIAPYTVEVTRPDHPLVAGIEAFEVRDELYVLELHPPIDVLLHTNFGGISPGFEESGPPPDAVRPILYLKDSGAGTVCFFGLGHCRGRYDMQTVGIEDFGRHDLGSWETLGFRTVLGRCLTWGTTGKFA